MSTKWLPPVSDALFYGLGHLGFQRFMPPAQLRPWVQCYWIARKDRHPDASASETVYPDGGTTLIFN